VGDVEGFLGESFGIAPHLATGLGCFDDLLSVADADRALTGSELRAPAVRVVRDGDAVPVHRYTRAARTGATRMDDVIDPGRVLALYADGATVVFQRLHRWWPPITELCRELEEFLGHAIQANAYLTPPGAAGLAPHHDTHDVFVLQVAGTKSWVVREPLIERPLPRHRCDHAAALGQPVVAEHDLRPGDALYVPRGFVHSASTQRGLSLHLTLGLLGTTVLDVLDVLVDRAAEDERFRELLPLGHPFDHDVARRAVEAAVADLVDWLDTVDSAEVATTVSERFVARRAPSLGGQLLELARLDGIDDATVIGRRAGTSHALRVDDESLVLILGDRRLTLPAALEPAVRRLSDGAARPVGDLADLLDAPSRLVLVRRLVAEGLLVTGPTDG
jgi:bifunctional lysine-specific demethylase and histidyl-hydroxylase NO66